MIDLVFQNFSDDKSFDEKFFKNVFEVAVEEIKFSGKSGLSLNLVSEGKIKELNIKHRNKDKVTDVLSFPMNEKTDIGDIFICLPFAKKEAKRENIDIELKLAQLTVHGFLHLVGYDHELSKRDSDKMFKLENKILNKIHVL